MTTTYTSDYKLQRKLVRIATIARNVAQTPIATKRMAGFGDKARLVDNNDEIGSEERILPALIHIFIQAQDLAEEVNE